MYTTTSVLMSSLMRSGPAGNILAASQALTIRGSIGYENVRTRNRSYRSAAKEKRKLVRRERMAGAGNAKDSGEEIPPFFMPQRYKLLYKVMEDHKNSSRLGRKPMPQEVKQKLAQVSKAYNEFKTAEKTLVDTEKMLQMRTQIKAMDAIIFLPDYLLEETMSDSGAQVTEDVGEFASAVVYMEQMMQMFPPEQTCRLRLLPAFEESLMRAAEAQNEEMNK